MSYHSPTNVRSGSSKVLGGATARMPAMSATGVGVKSVKLNDNLGLEKPYSATLSMDELGLSTEAEKKRRGYLSTYLEGQTSYNKVSSFLGGNRI